MKFNLPLLLAALLSISLLSYRTHQQSELRQARTQADSLFPELPTNYLNYANIALPRHLDNPPTQAQDNTPATNPITDAGATLGRVLFYDLKLSQNETIACASCHIDEAGFSDNRSLSRGFEGGLTGRNSMGLANARFYTNGRFFWDERAATLEEQTLMPIQDHIEMGMSLDSLEMRLQSTDYYPSLFDDAFGTPTVSSDRISRALAQFVRSMVSYQSKYDQGRLSAPPGPPTAPFNNFTAAENDGKDIFFNAQRGGCAVCHGSENFVGPEARNNGLYQVYPDSGLFGVTADPADVGKFKVPSLRNIALTFPYMHDGSLSTLRDVIEHYDQGVQAHPNLDPRLRLPGPGGPGTGPVRRLNLTQTEKDNLLAFLHTLTDTAFIYDERWSDPFVEVSNTAMDEDLSTADLSVYPNPFSETLNIRFSNPNHQLMTISALQPAGAASPHAFYPPERAAAFP
jgi:cytochrome c peroxidase